ELRRRRIDADHLDAAPGEPRRDIGCSASELDAGPPGKVPRQHAKPGFGHAPDAPRRLRLRPPPLAGGAVVPRLRVPARSISPDVLRQRAVDGHVAHQTPRPIPPIPPPPRPPP